MYTLYKEFVCLIFRPQLKVYLTLRKRCNSGPKNWFTFDNGMAVKFVKGCIEESAVG